MPLSEHKTVQAVTKYKITTLLSLYLLFFYYHHIHPEYYATFVVLFVLLTEEVRGNKQKQ